MPFLYLNISGIVVDKVEIDFSSMETESERESYLKRVGDELFFSHFNKIDMVGGKYEIYLDHPSKINEGV